MKKTLALASVALLLTACANPSQNNYGEEDVGHNTEIFYGKVVSERTVAITGKNSGVGVAAGAVAGGVGGSLIGQGKGSVVGLLAGAIIGGVAGGVAEQAIKDRQGIEYIIRFYDSGRTQSIVQNIAKTDEPIAKGECVMVQMSGNYQRVLPADDDAEECHKHQKHHKKHKEEDNDNQ